jgi:hypothetical protein
MPIRINLLAETQAAEELRRKDPVKRAVLGGILLLLAVLVWSSTIQVAIIASRSELNNLQASWKRIEKNYQVAVETKRKTLEAQEKLVALQQLTTNRFLWGTTLDALQQTLNGIDDVQVTRVKADQSYAVEELKGTRAPDGRVVLPTKAAGAVEKIVMTIEAVDSSPQPGSRINRFKASIANEPFFQSTLQKTNGVTLLSFSPPQMDGAGRNPYVKFSLQCLFPEKIR